MASSTAGPATSSSASAPVGSGAKTLQLFVFALFFIFGGITSLNDVLIPKLKDLFTLSYAQAMLVQSAFFFAYFTISMPAASLVQRIGYMRTGVVGLVVMLIGCLLFIPAAASALFPAFLAALFVLAAGITTVQVVANPLISMLGDPKTASSRLTFAQAFNSLGTTIFPYAGSALILGSLTRVDPKTLSGEALTAYQAREAHVVGQGYLGVAVALAVVAIAVWLGRKLLVEEKTPAPSLARAVGLLKRQRLAFGATCIFLYVGAEVAVGSLIVNYLMQTNVLGLDEQSAGKHIPLYWGGALVGRFVGAAILRKFNPGLVLACFATGSISLLAISGLTSGTISGYSLLAVGLCNSIMFPTIFTLACEGLGKRAAEGSGIICVAIVGGAVIPPLTGALADVVGLKMALILPALCYGVILLFGLYGRKSAPALEDDLAEIAPAVV